MLGVKREVLSVRNYKAGYQVREERVEMEEMPAVIMKSAYTPTGAYIGNSVDAYRLCHTGGIKPEVSPASLAGCEGGRPDKANGGIGFTCSIGFCDKKQKWAGWSHRALAFFGIGDIVEEDSCCASSGWSEEYLEEHPEEDMRLPVGFQAQTLDDARLMAIAFAESVG